MKLSLTRAIIDAVHSGVLAAARTVADPVFGFGVITDCPGVPSDVLTPRNAWADKAAYDAAARKLAGLFAANFRQYQEQVDREVKEAGPRI